MLTASQKLLAVMPSKYLALICRIAPKYYMYVLFMLVLQSAVKKDEYLELFNICI